MKRAGIFLLLTFTTTWLMEIFLSLNGGLNHSMAQLVMLLTMLIPGGITFVVRGITKEGFQDPLLLPKFKKNWKYMLFAWLGTPLLVAVGMAVYFVVFPGQFDPQMNTAVNQYLQAYAGSQYQYTADDIRRALYVQIAGTLVIPVFFNGLMCFCEELGFRGYLQTKLENIYGTARSIVLSGIIWGIWYSPWIYMGYMYGRDYSLYPILGFGAMIVYCMVVGVYLSWLRVQTGSIWPGAIASTMLNGASTIYAYFINTNDYNLFLGPCPTGVLGCTGFILMAVFCVVHMKKTSRI